MLKRFSVCMHISGGSNGVYGKAAGMCWVAAHDCMPCVAAPVQCSPVASPTPWQLCLLHASPLLCHALKLDDVHGWHCRVQKGIFVITTASDCRIKDGGQGARAGICASTC